MRIIYPVLPQTKYEINNSRYLVIDIQKNKKDGKLKIIYPFIKELDTEKIYSFKINLDYCNYIVLESTDNSFNEYMLDSSFCEDNTGYFKNNIPQYNVYKNNRISIDSEGKITLKVMYK